MNQPHDIRNLIRAINQLGRKTTEVIHLDYGEIGDGELLDREVVSSVQETGIEIKETSYKRQLDCGHMARASDIAAVCDICGGTCCEKECAAICYSCHRILCRYCYKVHTDEEGEKTYCSSCYMDVKARRTAINASRAIFRFFVKE